MSPTPAAASRILVVDDTPANLQTLAAILKEKGYRISVATNGRQALEVVEKVEPDLILLDVMMPEMDGFETCRRLKASENGTRFPSSSSPRRPRRPTSCRASSWAPSTTSPSPSTPTSSWRASTRTSRWTTFAGRTNASSSTSSPGRSPTACGPERKGSPTGSRR